MEALHPLTLAYLRPPLLSTTFSSSSKPLPLFHLSKFSSSSSSSNAITLCRSSRWAERLLDDFHFLPTTSSATEPPSSSDPSPFSLPVSLPLISSEDLSRNLPIDFYKILGAELHFLGDGIRRAFEARVSMPPMYSFSQEALIGRRKILQVAFETLSDPEAREVYNRGLAEDPDSIIGTYLPADMVPGAICVLQEIGETELVLQVGRSLLSERLPKSFKQDVVLAMVLAYVDLSRDAMALDPPDFIGCCELLEWALKLLKEEGASNLAPNLQSQIDETLEDITPRYILQLLALPLDEENRTRRDEGLQRVRNTLWAVGSGGAAAVGGGFTRETFMNESYLHMTAAEQVDIFTTRPSNIPAESFEAYGVALALVAQAFVSKKPNLIWTADNLFEQLQQTFVRPIGYFSEYAAQAEVDFSLQRGLCSLLLGDIENCLRWLGLDTENSPYRNLTIVEFIMDNCDIDQGGDLLPGLCKLLETWLAEEVLSRFRDTQDLSFRLGYYYDNPIVLNYLEQMEGDHSSPLAVAAAIVRIGAGATIAFGSVKTNVLQAIRAVFLVVNKGENLISEENHNASSMIIELQNDQPMIKADQVGSYMQVDTSGKTHSEDLDNQGLAYNTKNVVVKIASAAVVVGLLAATGVKYISLRNTILIANKEADSATAANFINSETAAKESGREVPKMDARLAETLVRKWQSVKAQALGPNHLLMELPEVLEGRMLKIWTDRATEIAQNGWYWEYRLLTVTIDNMTISLDGRRATVEARINETAQLMDDVKPEHNDSYSTTYTTRYEMAYCKSGWKITEGAVLKS